MSTDKHTLARDCCPHGWDTRCPICDKPKELHGQHYYLLGLGWFMIDKEYVAWYLKQEILMKNALIYGTSHPEMYAWYE